MQIASTNSLERVNKEMRRRSDVIGIFRDDEAIRLVGALMIETNDEWAVARRFMAPEPLARISHADPGQAARGGRLNQARTSPKTGAPTRPLGHDHRRTDVVVMA